ncbi:hypothetical protein [Microbacterium sp.]|uniref:hypothetical protein n=1 Tax=Microbacterium sp. TaxID=51671 RepID=UPI003F713914
MTKNRRYEAHYDRLNDAKIAQAAAAGRLVTLPQQAYGPEPIRWSKEKPPVWAWVSWSDGPATRIEAFAAGWNDRVVIVEWEAQGGRRDTVVWRNAVTRRMSPTPSR